MIRIIDLHPATPVSWLTIDFYDNRFNYYDHCRHLPNNTPLNIRVVERLWITCFLLSFCYVCLSIPHWSWGGGGLRGYEQFIYCYGKQLDSWTVDFCILRLTLECFDLLIDWPSLPWFFISKAIDSCLFSRWTTSYIVLKNNYSIVLKNNYSIVLAPWTAHYTTTWGGMLREEKLI